MDLTRAERLKAFIKPFFEQPVVWGESDCSSWPAKWLATELNLPAIPHRYSDRDGALAYINERGGLLGLWDDWLAEQGISERFGEPQLGDVAIIDTRLYGHIGGICADRGVLLLRSEGRVGVSFFGPVRKFVKVWAVS